MLHLGIIGTGVMASQHARQLQPMESVFLAACADVSEGNRNRFAQAYDVPKVYGDPQAMLDQEVLDGVIVSTSDAAHAQWTLAALEKGLGVFCEKPLATSTRDAWHMVEKAERAGLINMVNFTYRRSSALRKARDLVQQGRLGQLRNISAHHFQSWLVGNFWGDWKETDAFLWRLSKNHNSSGVLGDIGCHIVDFTTYVCGPISRVFCDVEVFPKSVPAPYKGYSLDANDSACLLVRFVNGALGTISVSRWATGHTDSVLLEVQGTNGALKVDLDKGENILWLCEGEQVHGPDWTAVDCGPGRTVGEDFIAALLHGKTTSPGFREGALVQEYIEKSFASAEAHQPVTL